MTSRKKSIFHLPYGDILFTILNSSSGTCLVKTHDVIPQIGATCGSHDLDTSQVLAELNADLAHLQGQLSRWHHYYGWIETEMEGWSNKLLRMYNNV